MSRGVLPIHVHPPAVEQAFSQIVSTNLKSVSNLPSKKASCFVKVIAVANHALEDCGILFEAPWLVAGALRCIGSGCPRISNTSSAFGEFQKCALVDTIN